MEDTNNMTCCIYRLISPSNKSYNGIEYPSAMEASKQLGINNSLISYRLRHKYPGYILK